IFVTFRKGCRELLTNFDHGRMRLGFIFAVIVYNWTEAGFRALHLVLYAFYIIAVDYPTATAQRPAVASDKPRKLNVFPKSPPPIVVRPRSAALSPRA